MQFDLQPFALDSVPQRAQQQSRREISPGQIILGARLQDPGSRGASGERPPELEGAGYLDSIQQTASLARYVRVKFYRPGADGSEPLIDYPRVFDILRGVHYHGFVDIVYEPGRFGGDDIRQAMLRIVSFLRSQLRPGW